MESDSEGLASSDSSMMSDQSLDHSLSDHSGFKHKFHHPLESRYSGTVGGSENADGDTQGSVSEGTSGDGISVSTQSIEIVPYEDFYENANVGGEMITVNHQTTTGQGGVTWQGDGDNEIIFGT